MTERPLTNEAQLGRSTDAIHGMTCHTLLSDLRESSHGILQVSIHRAFLCQHGEPARGSVHLRAKFLHLLWHVRRHMCCTMSSKRRHSDALLGHIGGSIERTGTESLLDLRERQQMIAHIREHMLLHRSGHVDELSRVVLGTACDGRG